MTSAIPLVCGDPDGESPATFSRFVLPFAYQPEPVSVDAKDDGPVFRQVETAGEMTWARWRYPTTETATALFRRARWCQLVGQQRVVDEDGGIGFGFTVPRRRGGRYRVQVAPPRLVLFEWDAVYARYCGLGAAARSAKHEPDKHEPDILATGFLILDLHAPAGQPKPPELDDLLELNELFRYWRQPFDRHAGPPGDETSRYRRVLGEVPMDPLSRPAETVAQGSAEQIYTPRWTSFLERPLDVGDDHFRLFPLAWSEQAAEWLRDPTTEGGTGWAGYADNRAFVWTCALIEGGLGALAERFGGRENRASSATPWLDWLSIGLKALADAPDGQPRPGAADFGHWIRLLNVDPPGETPEASSAFERALAAEGTYRRWEEAGTTYGFTYHSGAMLSEPCPEPPLWRHFADMYFDQALILLYLRVTSFRFSRRLFEIVAAARDMTSAPGHASWRDDFQALRREFVLFTDLYQFPLLTNQQQGVEMYAAARRALDVDELFQEMQAEVSTTHEFFAGESARELSEVEHRLNRLAGIGLPVALVTGALGMNVIVPSGLEGWRGVPLGLVLLVALGAGAALTYWWPQVIDRLRGCWTQIDRRLRGRRQE